MAVRAEPERCPTCKRWDGPRHRGPDGDETLLDDADATGLCTDGPWHGSRRGARNACGQWICWISLRKR